MKTGVKIGIAALAAVAVVGCYVVMTKVEQATTTAPAARAGAPQIDRPPAQDDTTGIPVPQVTADYQTLPETPGVMVSPPRAAASKSN